MDACMPLALADAHHARTEPLCAGSVPPTAVGLGPGRLYVLHKSHAALGPHGVNRSSMRRCIVPSHAVHAPAQVLRARARAEAHLQQQLAAVAHVQFRGVTKAAQYAVVRRFLLVPVLDRLLVPRAMGAVGVLLRLP